ncbi:hypothetical protein I4F81_000941 [Pyropia yezoensis]|uniref:Uncharacterized protein n=1 Tax=Pyropia yezoensis TaxID=2788 RepID=A0ACC3BKA1_PYRYE|nr:hypothetical protein I4F81_000941 [Neopyropia yezoensis]
MVLPRLPAHPRPVTGAGNAAIRGRRRSAAQPWSPCPAAVAVASVGSGDDDDCCGGFVGSTRIVGCSSPGAGTHRCGGASQDQAATSVASLCRSPSRTDPVCNNKRRQQRASNVKKRKTAHSSPPRVGSITREQASKQASAATLNYYPPSPATRGGPMTLRSRTLVATAIMADVQHAPVSMFAELARTAYRTRRRRGSS